MIDTLVPLVAIAALVSGVLWFHDWLRARDRRRQREHMEASERMRLRYQRLRQEEEEEHDRRLVRIWYGETRDEGEPWE